VISRMTRGEKAGKVIGRMTRGERAGKVSDHAVGSSSAVKDPVHQNVMIADRAPVPNDRTVLREAIRAQVDLKRKELPDGVPEGHSVLVPTEKLRGESQEAFSALKVEAEDLRTKGLADFGARSARVISVRAADKSGEVTVATVLNPVAKDSKPKEVAIPAKEANAQEVFANVTRASLLGRALAASERVDSKDRAAVQAALQNAKVVLRKSAETETRESAVMMIASLLSSRGLKSKKKQLRSINGMKRRRKIRMH
jgi:hypothetical protein